MRLALICFYFAVSVAALLPAATFAADAVAPRAPPASPGVAPPPPAAAEARSPAPETGLEPEVTITTRGDATHHEYRVNGKLYMVKVVPKRGKPYYLIDHEGSGQLRRSDLEPTISVPNWVIKSW